MSDPGPAIGMRAIAGLGLAATLVPLNSTMIAVALPDVAADLDIASGRAGLLVTMYLVVMVIGQPTMGRVADRFGSRRVLRWALAGFAVCSIATSFAEHFFLLVLGRAVQAVFGAALMPSAQSLLRTAVSAAQRGRAFGVQGSFIGAGAVGGPVIGGAVTDLTGWQGVFLVNVPIIAATFIILAGLPAGHEAQGPGRPRVGMTALLRAPVFRAAFAVQAATTMGQYSLLLTIPIVLDARGWSSTNVGLALMGLAFGNIVLGPAGGRAGDRFGQRRPAVWGTGVAAIGAVGAATFVDGPPAAVITSLIVFGLGLGFSVPNVMTAGLEAAPDQAVGSASGLLSMSRYVGSIGSSLLLSVIVDDGGDGARTLLTIAAAATALAVLPAVHLPDQAAPEPDVGHARTAPSPAPSLEPDTPAGDR